MGEKKMKIKDLVKLDDQGEFISAVQLKDYYAPERNQQLVKSFIFAESGGTQQSLEAHYYGSLDLLDIFTRSFIHPGMENVYAVLADYGHGKSHFAVELMNYFEKPFGSTENDMVLDRIKLALPNRLDYAAEFKNFKKEKDRFLVLTLSGDSGKSIKEMLHASLQHMIEVHQGTKDFNLNLWNNDAIEFLEKNKNDQVTVDFLANELHTDIPTLIADIQVNRDSAWNDFVKVFTKTTGMGPTSAGSLNPQQVINKLVEDFIGEDKPFSGLVIIFDEFSQFIRTYSYRRLDADLGILLMAAQENKRKVLMILLGHNDPDQVAKVYARNNETALQDISKDLTRIEKKLNLYSLVESIMDSFLANQHNQWNRLFKQDNLIRGAFKNEITEYSWKLYENRYKYELNWEYQDFQETVVIGCFPLHPTTTGLLANLKMVSEVTDDARSLLRFVSQVYQTKKEQDITDGPRVNWVYPVELVDFFGFKLGMQHFNLFNYAKTQLPTMLGDNATDKHIDLLKALLLQHLDDELMKLKGAHQVKLLAHYMGETDKKVTILLTDLREHKVLRFERIANKFTFYPVGVDLNALDNLLETNIAGKNFNSATLIQFNKYLEKSHTDQFKNIEINLDWGHPAEWAAIQAVIIRENFSFATLSKLMPRVTFSANAPKLPVKGLVLWCLALKEEDIEYFKAKAQEVIAQAYNGRTAPPPVLVILPTQSNKELADHFLRYSTIQELKSRNKLQKISTDMVDSEEINLKLAIRTALKNDFFQIDPRDYDRFIYPKEYEASIKAKAATLQNLPDMVSTLYRTAYPKRPKNFFNDLKGYSTSNLTKAVLKVLPVLAINDMSNGKNYLGAPIEKRVIKYLTSQWRILNSAGFIVEPGDHGTKNGWQLFDEAIPANKKDVRLKDIFQKLLEAPYGFDFNTAFLVFTAWVGKHRSELRFTKVGRPMTVKDFFDFGEKANNTTKELNNLLFKDYAKISREDPGELYREVKGLLSEFENTKELSLAEANSFHTKFIEFLSKEFEDDILNADIKNAVGSIDISTKEFADYEDEVDRILSEINNASTPSNLLKQNRFISALKKPGLISSTKPGIEDLAKHRDRKLEQSVQALKREMAGLNSIENAGIYRKKIEEYRNALRGKLALLDIVDKAENALNNRAEDLNTKQNEVRYKSNIDAYSERSPLNNLQKDLSSLMSMPVPASLNEYRKKKAKKMEQEIKNYLLFAKDMQDSYKYVDDNELYQLKNKLVGQLSNFEDTNLYDDLLGIRQYLEKLESYFSTLRTISNIDLSKVSNLRKGLETIGEISEKYNKALSSDHINHVLAMQERLNGKLDEELLEANQKITALENLLDEEYQDTSGTLKVEEQKVKITSLRVLGIDELSKRLEKAETLLSKIKDIMDNEYTMQQIQILFKKLDPEKRDEIISILNNL
jgi:hypothetical protein